MNALDPLIAVSAVRAAKDLPEATEWALARPEGEPRELILGRISHARSQIDPVAAAGFVLDEMHPGPAQSEAIIAVIHLGSIRDAQAAEQWIRSFPEGVLRERGISEIKGTAVYQREAGSGR